MEIKNKKIINFFNEHPNLDFEGTILKFIDIMENLNEKMNNTMNNSMVSEILDNLKSMNSKIENVSSTVGKINENTAREFSLKMSELKKDYVEELKVALTCNVSDKIEPIFKEQNSALFDKTINMINTIIPKNDEIVVNSVERIIKQFQESVTKDTKNLLSNAIDEETFKKYIEQFDRKLTQTIETSQSVINNTLSTTEKRLEDRMENIKEITSTSSQSTNSLNGSLNDLLKKFENSSAKGKISENFIFNVIESLYPNAELESVGDTKETGDILMSRINKPKILIENKDWSRSVVQSEVVKFIRDIDVQKCCGIFLSQNGKITTKENFEINIHNGYVLVYVHDVKNDGEKIKLAVDIVDHLKDKLDEYQDDSNNQDNISKEMLEYINVEYQNFISSKTSLIKLAKEFNNKLIKQIEEIKMPTLENYLSTKYSFSSNKFVCEFCSFVGKNQQSRAAHLRGCSKRKEFLNQEGNKNGEKNICINIE